jgi:hypothetical protein
MTYLPIHIDNLSQIQDTILKMIPIPEYDRATLYYPNDNKKLVTEVDLLTQYLASVDLESEIHGVGVIIVNPKAQIPIHKDHGNYTYSLNIPLSGYQKTFVNFYKTNADDTLIEVQKKVGQSSGHRYNAFERDKCELIVSHESLTPYIMDTRIPHDVVNKSDTTRIFLLIRLKQTANEKIKSLLT